MRMPEEEMEVLEYDTEYTPDEEVSLIITD